MTSSEHSSSSVSDAQEHNSKKKPTAASKEGITSAKKTRKEKGVSTLGRPPGPAPKKLSGSTSSSALHTYGAEDHPSKTAIDGESRNGRESEILSDPLGDSIEEDDLFFSNESFDDLRAQAAENGTSDASGTFLHNRRTHRFKKYSPTCWSDVTYRTTCHHYLPHLIPDHPTLSQQTTTTNHRTPQCTAPPTLDRGNALRM